MSESRIKGLEAEGADVEIEPLRVALGGFLKKRMENKEDQGRESEGLEMDADGEEENGEEPAFENGKAPLDAGDENRQDERGMKGSG
jgi:hypothetical protein